MNGDNDHTDSFILKVSAGLVEKKKLIDMAGVNTGSFGSHFVSTDSYVDDVRSSRNSTGRSV